MRFSEDQKAQFAQSLSQWLTQWQVDFTKKTHSDTVLFKLKDHKFNIVLDFLETPYPFGSVNNICLSIDYFILRYDALYSRLQSLFNQTKRIHARSTTIKRMTKDEAQPFFEACHLSGYVQGHHNYGMFVQEKLVAAITFAKGRNFKIYDRPMRSYEWVGYCSLNGHTVVGGISKLIAHFAEEKRVDHLVTYLDKAWATTKSLEKLGFELVEELPPLPFRIDMESRKRVYPSRDDRAQGKINRHKFPFQNGGYLKFQQLYDSKH